MGDIISLVRFKDGKIEPATIKPTATSLKSRIGEAFGFTDKNRVALQARQASALIHWVDDTIDTIDQQFAVAQLEAALASAKRRA